MRLLVFVLLALATFALALASLVPLVPTQWWAARLLDFPRLYWGGGLALVALCVLPFLRRWPRRAGLVLAVALIGGAVDAAVLWPYRPSGADRVSTCAPERRLSVLIANVRLGNRNADPLLAMVAHAQPDLFLAMETDAWWDAALRPLTEAMPHTLQRITGSYYGIQLYSRLPLARSEIRYLAGRDTPAIVAGVTMQGGEIVDFIGLHPKPPQVLQSALGRDAELYAAAALLRDREEPGILAGDLNATPWEAAVGRMRRLSGLVDPRHGYGYVASWNARSVWLRWPLDHILHEGGFATLSIERLDAFGSDHFPYLARLCRRAAGQKVSPPPPETGDVATANAILAAAGASERLRWP